jgi:hypothetical protein
LHRPGAKTASRSLESKSGKTVVRTPPPCECARERILAGCPDSSRIRPPPPSKSTSMGEEKDVFSLSTWQSERSERRHVGRVANCRTTGNSPGGVYSDCTAQAQRPPAGVLNPNPGKPLSEHPLRANAREREFLLDVRIPRAFAHLPHRKGHRWRRRRHSGSGEESVIRLFMSHSLTVLRRANIHQDSVGDGREERRESTPAGIARPAKMTVFGARRAPPQK